MAPSAYGAQATLRRARQILPSMAESCGSIRLTLDPDRGFDPYIDLMFAGDFPLQRQYDLPTANDFAIGNNSEIPDLDPLAGLTLFDEIAIEARIEGHISQGVNLLTLTSSPAYSQDRLLSMLTGGYLADLPEGSRR